MDLRTIPTIYCTVLYIKKEKERKRKEKERRVWFSITSWRERPTLDGKNLSYTYIYIYIYIYSRSTAEHAYNLTRQVVPAGSQVQSSQGTAKGRTTKLTIRIMDAKRRGLSSSQVKPMKGEFCLSRKFSHTVGS